jgi:uncharacterized membrane protein
MANNNDWNKRIDVVLIVIAVIILSTAIGIWIIAMPIAKEIVFIATTIALVISLVLIVNVAILAIFRMQKRIDKLESVLTESGDPADSPGDEEVLVVTLSNIERRIINRLEENGGKMTQDELRRVTGLSKSTLSVTLTALERKTLVSREVSGRTKMVNLEKHVSR